MSSKSSSVCYARISRRVNVQGIGERTSRDAARFIEMGYRVTDHHGFDLTVMTGDGGQRYVDRGEDSLDSHNSRINSSAAARAVRLSLDSNGRPIGLRARQLTDYELSTHPCLTLKTLGTLTADEMLSTMSAGARCQTVITRRTSVRLMLASLIYA